MSRSVLGSVLTLSNLTFMTTVRSESFSYYTYEDTGSER